MEGETKSVEHVDISNPLEDDNSMSLTSMDTEAIALAQLGYKQEFRRAFSILEVFCFALSTIGIVPSIASVLTFSIPNGGPYALVWGWAGCVPFLMIMAVTLAELGSAAPTSGGMYYWTFKYAPPRWRRLLSWIVGYCNTMALVAGLASVDWSCAIQIFAAVSIGSDMTFTPTTQQTFGLYVALLLCHGLMASVASRVIARLQWVYTFVNILLSLAVIIALPVATSTESRNSPEYAFGGVVNISGWPNGFAFMLSFLSPLYTISGFDASVHISEEVSNARMAVPLAMISSSAVACIIGLGINITLAFCMGTNIQGIMSSPIGQPLATIFFNSFGKVGTLAIWSLLIFAQVLTGANVLIISSRQTFALTRDGALPFSSILYHMHSRVHTPVRCVWACALIALILGLLALGGTAASSAIFSLSVSAQFIAYIVPISSKLFGGEKWIPGPFSLGRWSRPVGIISIIWMVFAITIFSFPASPDPSSTSMNWMVVVLGAWILLCSTYYYFPVYGGIHWFVGPKVNVNVVNTAIGVETWELTGREGYYMDLGSFQGISVPRATPPL